VCGRFTSSQRREAIGQRDWRAPKPLTGGCRPGRRLPPISNGVIAARDDSTCGCATPCKIERVLPPSNWRVSHSNRFAQSRSCSRQVVLRSRRAQAQRVNPIRVARNSPRRRATRRMRRARRSAQTGPRDRITRESSRRTPTTQSQCRNTTSPVRKSPSTEPALDRQSWGWRPPSGTCSEADRDESRGRREPPPQ
jgi:hypothetical protein